MSYKIWLLIVVLFLSFLSISPWKSLDSGVLIKSVEKNSTAFTEGLRQGMVIIEINGEKINNFQDYTERINNLFKNNEEIKVDIITKNQEFIFLTKSIDITVSDLPNTNIKTGLDLSGGSRALVRPANLSVTSSEIDNLISLTSERLNVYGLTDLTIRPIEDLNKNYYMLIEIAGATPNELEELVGKQGKFEAKIGEELVFSGGDKDIASVCKTDASCARIESCYDISDGAVCKFSFAVYLSEDAAKRHANITAGLKVNSTEQGRYLEKKLDLYLDNVLTSSLLISEGLKGVVTTQISVSGSGTGKNQEEAYKSAKEDMNKLQTVLLTGSLPYKLEIVKLDTISPVLGKEFSKNILILIFSVFLIISVILFIKYRKIKITLSVILTMFSEAFITLGIASLIQWNLDIPSIAGIIAGMGTGVNDQIIIIDESVSDKTISILERIKRALFVILGAFLTICAAMLPLFWAGAGLLRGFALTTIIGVSVGILITRPAFAEILKRIEG